MPAIRALLNKFFANWIEICYDTVEFQGKGADFIAATMKDIAEAAGVSIGTVDRALKNRGRINSEVAERIRRIAKDLNYSPNRIASGLAKKSRAYRIAVIYSIQPSEFWTSVTEGIRRAEAEIRPFGFSIEMYYGSAFDPSVQIALIEQALADGADAMIIVPVNDAALAERLRQLCESGFPVLFLNSYLENVTGLCAIRCDYYRSGRIAAALLRRLSKDHAHALAFLPSPRMLGNNARMAGIRDSFARHPEMVLDDIVELAMDRDIDVPRIREAVRSHPLVGHIIYNGDLGVYRDALGPRLQELHTVSFDMVGDTRDALLSGELEAVVSQAQESQGTTAVEALFRYLSEGIVPPPETIFENRIVFRECVD